MQIPDIRTIIKLLVDEADISIKGDFNSLSNFDITYIYLCSVLITVNNYIKMKKAFDFRGFPEFF